MKEKAIKRINLNFAYYFGKNKKFPTRGRMRKVKDFVKFHSKDTR